MNTLTLQNVDALCKEHGWWKVGPILPQDQAWLAKVAKDRNDNAKKKGHKNRAPSDDDSCNLSGIAGEWAVGLVYNLPIRQPFTTGVVDPQVADVGSFIQAKSARSATLWNLVEDKQSFDKHSDETIYAGVLTCLYPSLVVVNGLVSRRRLAAEARATKRSDGKDIFIFPWEKLAKPSALFDTSAWRHDVVRFGRAARQREN